MSGIDRTVPIFLNLPVVGLEANQNKFSLCSKEHDVSSSDWDGMQSHFGSWTWQAIDADHLSQLPIIGCTKVQQGLAICQRSLGKSCGNITRCRRTCRKECLRCSSS